MHQLGGGEALKMGLSGGRYAGVGSSEDESALLRRERRLL
jgi:hypothetical protein